MQFFVGNLVPLLAYFLIEEYFGELLLGCMSLKTINKVRGPIDQLVYMSTPMF